jgi:hypothetical protein
LAPKVQWYAIFYLGSLYYAIFEEDMISTGHAGSEFRHRIKIPADVNPVSPDATGLDGILICCGR